MPIRDRRAKRARIEVLNTIIPGLEDRLRRFYMERAGLETAVMKVEAHELGRKHDGLCGEVDYPNGKAKCERYYGHTGKHSWEGGGYG